eukprot:1161549-Pelagomonas_calceolata.AAC.2
MQHQRPPRWLRALHSTRGMQHQRQQQRLAYLAVMATVLCPNDLGRLQHTGRASPSLALVDRACCKACRPCRAHDTKAQQKCQQRHSKAPMPAEQQRLVATMAKFILFSFIYYGPRHHEQSSLTAAIRHQWLYTLLCSRLKQHTHKHTHTHTHTHTWTAPAVSARSAWARSRTRAGKSASALAAMCSGHSSTSRSTCCRDCLPILTGLRGVLLLRRTQRITKI